MNRLTRKVLHSVFLSLLGISFALTTVTASAADDVTIQQLEGALSANPDNHVLHYYLGSLYLRAGRTDEAIREWDAYVASGSTDSKFVAVREQLTVLKLNQARDNAAQAVRGGESAAQPAEANTVAVLEFRNLGGGDLNPFVKGLTAMIITDLSKVPQLQVVERTRMQALMDEMKLAQMGIVDENTSAKVGRLLQAQIIDWGELMSLRDDNIRVRTTISDTYTRSTVGETTAEGLKQNFFEIEKKIVFDILAQLGINKEDLPPDVLAAIEEVETRNYDAFLLYGMGLFYLDNRNYPQAKEAFGQAADLDPDFGLADTAEKTTPVVENLASGFAAEKEREETTVATADVSGTSSEADLSAATTSDSSGSDNTTAADPGRALFESVAGEETSTENIEATQKAIDLTTDLRQDEVVVDLGGGSGGPGRMEGYFTNMLRNAGDAYHGIYYTGMLQDLTDWEAFSTWPGGHAAGSEETINELVVVDDTDPVTTGLPNDTTWTEMGRNAYMVWGHWSDDDEMVRQSNPTSPGGHYLFSSRGYFVYGDATTPEQFTELTANEVFAIYSGDAYGTHAAAPNETMTGTFESFVSFFQGFADVSDFQLMVESDSHSASLTGATGHFFDDNNFQIFGGTWLVDGQGLSGMDLGGAAGSLYGPSGTGIGGIFYVEKDAGLNSVQGMFVGEFQEEIH